jgi:hypothetical protein
MLWPFLLLPYATPTAPTPVPLVITSACLSETAAATTIVLATQNRPCSRWTRIAIDPDRVTIVMKQSAKRLGSSRSFVVDAGTVLAGAPGTPAVTGSIAYSLEGPYTGQATFVLRVGTRVVRGSAPLQVNLWGD